METEPTFGVWLRQQRRRLDWTQAELAQRVGYSVATIRKLERDELRPSRPLAEALAGALQIALEERAAFVRFARDTAGAEAAPLPIQTLSPTPGHQVQTTPSNLPLPTSALIGRETEVAAVCHQLGRPNVRLL